MSDHKKQSSISNRGNSTDPKKKPEKRHVSLAFFDNEPKEKVDSKQIAKDHTPVKDGARVSIKDSKLQASSNQDKPIKSMIRKSLQQSDNLPATHNMTVCKTSTAPKKSIDFTGNDPNEGASLTVSF